jgi:hypothetical protein
MADQREGTGLYQIRPVLRERQRRQAGPQADESGDQQGAARMPPRAANTRQAIGAGCGAEPANRRLGRPSLALVGSIVSPGDVDNKCFPGACPARASGCRFPHRPRMTAGVRRCR